MDLSIIDQYFGDNPWVRNGVVLGAVLLLCFVAYYVAKRGVIRLVTFLVKRSKTHWDDIVLERGVFNRLAFLAPMLVIYYSIYLAPTDWEPILHRLLMAAMQLTVIAVVIGILNAINDIYRTTERARDIPIKGYIQVVKLVLYLLGAIFIFSTAINQSPWGLLSGIGAATAVLLLVFKDTILSFVASIQIAASGMIKVGDWISMPQMGADGDVIDIALHRVTVQNWDKTIVYIPTFKFLDQTFKNWRGMSESGGRRIKRSVALDMTSVSFLSKEQTDSLAKIQLLKDYISEKQTELQKYNQEHGIDDATWVNGRRMTNLGTFRAYLVAYLKAHPQIHQDMTFLVRQLAPSPEGVAIEIYVFSKDIRWAFYEAIQADIFDHLLAALPEFGLRVFQNPTGADFRRLSAS